MGQFSTLPRRRLQGPSGHVVFNIDAAVTAASLAPGAWEAAKGARGQAPISGHQFLCSYVAQQGNFLSAAARERQRPGFTAPRTNRTAQWVVRQAGGKYNGFMSVIAGHLGDTLLRGASNTAMPLFAAILFPAGWAPLAAAPANNRIWHLTTAE